VSIIRGYIGIRYLIVDILIKEVATKYSCVVITSKAVKSNFLFLKISKILIKDMSVKVINKVRKKINEIYRMILDGLSKSDDDKIRFS